MIADIFYHIFTLKITILACLMQKKIKNWGPRRCQGIFLDPLVGLKLPPYPQFQKTTMCPYFFWIIPWHIWKYITNTMGTNTGSPI